MSTLWTFGGTYTADYTNEDTPVNKNFEEYKKIKDLEHVDMWPTILANRMKFDLVNTSRHVTSNYQIFQDFCDKSHLIKKDDVVLIEWVDFKNYRVAENNEFVNLEPNKKYDLDSVSQSSIDEMFKNRQQHIWLTELYRWINGINMLALEVGFKFFIWNAEDRDMFYARHKDMPKYDYILLCPNSTTALIDYLVSVAGTTIEIETEGKIKDKHFGRRGHETFSKLLFYQVVYSELGKGNTLI